VFSLFGLGVLDLAIGKHAYDFALAQGMGTSIGQFLPLLDRAELNQAHKLPVEKLALTSWARKAKGINYDELTNYQQDRPR
jgi:hypothetical protein